MIDGSFLVLFTTSVYVFSIVSMLFVRKYFKIDYRGFDFFILYFVFSLVALASRFLRLNLDSNIISGMASLLFVVSKYFLLRGLLAFLNKGFSKRVYVILVIVVALIMHTIVIAGFDDAYYLGVILLFNVCLHVYLLGAILEGMDKIRYGKVLVLVINIIYIVRYIVLGVVLLNSFGKTYDDYFLYDTALETAVSGMMFVAILVFYLDIMYKEIKTVNDRLTLAQGISKTGSWELDISSKLITASRVAFDIYGLEYSDGVVTLKVVQDLVVEEDRERLDAALYNLISNGKKYEETYRMITPAGEEKHIYSRAELEYDGNHPSRVVGVFVDVTLTKLREDRLMHISYHDPLTGLFNRRYYDETIVEYNSNPYYPLSVIVMDINGLKELNDVFGHSAGDELLIQAASLFRDNLKDKEFVARIGGDEFVMILPNTMFDEAQQKVKMILEGAKQYEVKGNKISLSLGVATKITPSVDFSIVFNDAEKDMYNMKLMDKSSMRGSTINTILNTLHEKDQYSEEHSRNVSYLSAMLADELGLSLSQRNNVKMAGILHDIGKIIVSDDILMNPGKLSEAEYIEIKKHSEFGYRILNASGDLSYLSDIVLSHHERWDGRGYPNGLKGEEIPLLSRVITIVDAFDAMTSDRAYKARKSIDEAIAELEKCSGTQFDPELVPVFIKYIKDNKEQLMQ